VVVNGACYTRHGDAERQTNAFGPRDRGRGEVIGDRWPRGLSHRPLLYEGDVAQETGPRQRRRRRPCSRNRFFNALGMTPEGETRVEGAWVDRVNGLEGVQADIVMMRTPDGLGRLELTTFRKPDLVELKPAIAPPNRLGLRSVMFAGESVDDTVARLRANGAELAGEVAQYEEHVQTLLRARPRGHHRRAGRGTHLEAAAAMASSSRVSGSRQT